jgi:hypothetical protein
MTPQKLFKRYQNGYRVGKLINGLGIAATMIGLILGFALSDLGFQAAKVMDQNNPAAQWVRDNLQINILDQQVMLFGIGLVAGLILFFLFWLAGMFISAVGQILKALLDTAVNTSPLLSADEKGSIIR